MVHIGRVIWKKSFFSNFIVSTCFEHRSHDSKQKVFSRRGTQKKIFSNYSEPKIEFFFSNLGIFKARSTIDHTILIKVTSTLFPKKVKVTIARYAVCRSFVRSFVRSFGRSYCQLWTANGPEDEVGSG